MRASLAIGALAAVLAVAVYGHRIGDTPAYIGLDEAHFGNHAYSLATTGRDLNGNLLPLFVSLEDPLGDRPALPWGTTWYHPIGFYLIASVLMVAPSSEWAIRLPLVLVGVLNLCLVYQVVRRWYRSRALAACAAAMLAMTPSHFILSRLALDYLLPLPFILGWLWCVTTLMREPSRRRGFVTGLVLGLGCFSYVSSWLMMPIYLAITIVVTIVSARRDLIVPLIGGFVTPLLMLVPWVIFHPDMPANILAQYQAGETRRSVVTALLSGSGVAGAVRDALSAYWSYFDPSFLFVSGGSSRLVSTGSIGVWPAGVAVLLAIGLVQIARQEATPWRLTLLAGLLLAPVPAALKGEPFAIQRAIALLPFGVLLATDGFATAMAHRSIATRVAILAVVATIPLQFSGFVRDYFGDYAPRAARALDPTAFRETAAVLFAELEKNGEHVVALTTPLYDVSAKWRFYCTTNGRLDLLARTRYFSGDLSDIRDLPPGTLAVVDTAASRGDGWVTVATPRSVYDETPLTVLRRQ